MPLRQIRRFTGGAGGIAGDISFSEAPSRPPFEPIEFVLSLSEVNRIEGIFLRYCLSVSNAGSGVSSARLMAARMNLQASAFATETNTLNNDRRTSFCCIQHNIEA